MSELNPQDLRAALEARREDIQDLLCDLIRIPSTVGNEGPAMELLHDRVRGLVDVAEFIPVTEEIRNDPDFSYPVKGLQYGDRPNLRVVKRGLTPQPPLPAGEGESQQVARGAFLPSPAGRGAGGEAPSPSAVAGRGAGGKAVVPTVCDHRVRGVAASGKVAFAREQRRQATVAERALWERLRDGRLGVRFRRQHPIGDFVLDFYCAEAQLAVEVDGPVHAEQAGYDQWRDAELLRVGIKVLRLAERDVRHRMEAVLEAIRRGLTPQPPLPAGEGESRQVAHGAFLPSPAGRGAGGEAPLPSAVCRGRLPSPAGRGAGGEAPSPSDARPSLLFNTHLDVVPPSSMQEKPFDPQVRDGVVFGRGACDAKGQVACAYALLAALHDLGITPPADLIFHFVIEEEIGGNGTVAMVRRGERADACIVLEPSDFVILPQIRGAVWFETTVYGQSGHSGRPGGTVSALLKAIRAIEAFTEYHARCLAESRGKYPLFDRFENPAPLTIGQMAAGDWPAQAPQKAVFKGVLGILPDRTKEQVMDEMRAALRDAGDPWLAEHFEIEFTYRHDASVIAPDHPLVGALERACAAAGRPTSVSAMTASCDAWMYNNQLGIPTVVFGPGTLGVAHSDQEQIALDDILTGAQVLAALVAEGC